MADYELFRSPVGFDFDRMTRTQARAFFEHFVSQIPVRISMLEGAIRTSTSFRGWCADATERSLEVLSRWLEVHAARHDLTDQERETLRQSISGPLRDVLPGMHFELTPLSYSYARDVAMYLGEVVRHRNADAHWQLGPAKPRRGLFYNRPVLATPEQAFMEDPFWTVTGYMIEHVRTNGRKRIDLRTIAKEWDSRISDRRYYPKSKGSG